MVNVYSLLESDVKYNFVHHLEIYLEEHADDQSQF